MALPETGLESVLLLELPLGPLTAHSSGNMGQGLAMCVALGAAFGAIFDFTQRGKSKPKNDGA